MRPRVRRCRAARQAAARASRPTSLETWVLSAQLTGASGGESSACFLTDGSATFASAGSRARRSTLAGLAAIVISSPVAGFRPIARLLRRLDSDGQLPETAEPHLFRVSELPEDDLLGAHRAAGSPRSLIPARSATAVSSCVWVSSEGTPSGSSNGTHGRDCTSRSRHARRRRSARGPSRPGRRVHRCCSSS